MVDDSKKGYDEEYRFSEEDMTDDYLAEEEPVEKKTSGTFRNFITLFIVLFLLLFGLYKLGGYLFSSKQTTGITKPTSRVVVEPISEPIKPAVQIPSETQLPTEAQLPTAMEQLTQKVSILEVNVENNRNDINKISSNMDAIQKSLANMEDKLTNLGYNIQKLTQDLVLQQREIVELRVLVTPKLPVVKVHKVVIPRKLYYIQAVIPGRAWLRSRGRDSHTLTVSIGSHVPGYGRVTYIDPHAQEVTFHTGEVIIYSPDDNL